MRVGLGLTGYSSCTGMEKQPGVQVRGKRAKRKMWGKMRRACGFLSWKELTKAV